MSLKNLLSDGDKPNLNLNVNSIVSTSLNIQGTGEFYDSLLVTHNFYADPENDVLEIFGGADSVQSQIRMPLYSNAQRNLLTPVQGSLIFNTDTLGLEVYDGATWNAV